MRSPLSLSVALKSGRIRPYLELIRPPAVCTAPADALTGLAWGVGLVGCLSSVRPLSGSHQCLTLSDWLHRSTLSFLSDAYPLVITLLCILCSVCIYAAGMICNDLFDLEVDRRERPQRPLPSGSASVKVAWALALLLQGVALTLATSIGHFTALMALGTIICTYLYNGVFKSGLLGPLWMAGCRFGNGLIGASALSSLLAPPVSSTELVWMITQRSSLGWILGGTSLYVFTLTMLSRYEVEGGVAARRISRLLCGLTLMPLLWWCLGWLSWGALLSLFVAWKVGEACFPLWRDPVGSPQHIQGAMMGGIQGVALVNLTLCAGLGAWLYSAGIFLLTRLARRVARWFYAT